MRILVGVAAMVLAGCGGAGISRDAAAEIAALSQDAGIHQDAFAGAIIELSGEKGCQADYMRSQGGFSRLAGSPGSYFIHCGTLYSDTNVQTWYFRPSDGGLVRFKSEL